MRIVLEVKDRPGPHRAFERCVELEQVRAARDVDAVNAAARVRFAFDLHAIGANRQLDARQGRAPELHAVDAHHAIGRCAPNLQVARRLRSHLLVDLGQKLADLWRVPERGGLDAWDQTPALAGLLSRFRVVLRLHVCTHHEEAGVEHLLRPRRLPVELSRRPIRQALCSLELSPRRFVVGARQVTHGSARALDPKVDIALADRRGGRRTHDFKALRCAVGAPNRTSPHHELLPQGFRDRVELFNAGALRPRLPAQRRHDEPSMAPHVRARLTGLRTCRRGRERSQRCRKDANDQAHPAP